MKKNVLVSISGTQFMPTAPDEAPIEVITNGNYYKKNNKHYVVYEEILEGGMGVTKNLLKFDDNMLNLTRTGAINTSMLFEENRRNLSNYITPFGELTIGIDASKVECREEDDEINVNVDYSIDVNYEYLGDCAIKVRIQSKG